MKKVQKTIASCRLIRNLLVLLVAVLLGAGCAVAPPQSSLLLRPEGATATPTLAELNTTLSAVALQQPPTSPADYHVGPEDVLEITLFNVPPTEAGVTPRTLNAPVSQHGVITLPLLGDIPAAGLTTAGLEQILQGRYKKYLRDPQVGVQVKEYHSHRVSVIGEVGKPGVFEISGPKTLIDLLAMAGGVSDKAGSQVHLYRQGPEGRESYVVDLYALARGVGANVGEANLPVVGGDVINVPKAGMFSVDGAVKSPGSFPLSRPYTLTQALSMSGGVDTELAKTSEITILRRQGAEVETVLANLNEIQTGKIPDPQIAAEDVIVVPISTSKYLVKRFVGVLFSGVGIRPY